MQSKFFSRFLFVGLMFWIAPLKAQSILSTDMELGMRSMKGHFKLQNSEQRDNFGVIRAGLDFNIGDVTLTSRLNSYIDHEYHTEAKLNLKYAF